MNRISRRSLSRWAASQIIDGQPPKDIAKRLAAVLIENKQTDQLGFLVDDVIWELEQAGALACAKVTSAQPLSKQIESALRTHIKKAAKTAEVTIDKQVDKSVLGGLRVETAGKVWDQTVTQRLTELREAF